MKKDEEKKHPLQWFIQFSNLDLKSISPGDRAKLLVESDNLFPDDEVSYERLPLWLKKRLAWLRPEARQDKNSDAYWRMITRAQKSIQETFLGLQMKLLISPERLKTMSKEERKEIEARPNMIVLRGGHDHVLWSLSKGIKSPYHLQFVAVTPRQGDYLRLKIYRLLEGLPPHCITRCDSCGLWFLNLRKGLKRFCSVPCMWRGCTKEYREKNKPAYNKSQAKLMRIKFLKEKGLQDKKIKPPERKSSH